MTTFKRQLKKEDNNLRSILPLIQVICLLIAEWWTARETAISIQFAVFLMCFFQIATIKKKLETRRNKYNVQKSDLN